MPTPPRRIALLGAAVAWISALPLTSQDAPSRPATDPIPGVAAVSAIGATGDLPGLTDGRVAAEGSPWDAPVAVRLDSARGEVVFDLGQPRELRAALLQADADDSYLLEGSLDGRDFTRLARATALPGLAGLRTRALRWAAAPARYLRLRPSGGDGLASVSELQIFSVDPAAWTPRLEVVRFAPREGGAEGARWWNDASSRVWELGLALVALGALALERRDATRGPRGRRKAWNRIYAALFGVAILTYFNFGAFHFGNFLHNWDTFHYYIGAKYFPELRYDGLYDCVAVADAADPGLRPRVEARRIRDLRRNVLVPASAILSSPEACTARFTPERWRSFEHDVAWFRARENAVRWDEMSADHGFNATPVWMIAGSALANLAPATNRSIAALALVDPFCFLAMAAVLVWGFGLRAATVALLVLATSFPSRFFWTGGAFLRWDWLFFVVAAAALSRRGRPFAAGAALGYAALLRIFPAIIAAGPLLAIAAGALAPALLAVAGRRREAVTRALAGQALRPHLRSLCGTAVAAATLLAASLVVVEGPSAWREFAANTAKHKSTPLTNNMGLATVLTYRPSEVGRILHSEQAAEPWARWKEARLAARARMLPLQALLAAGALALAALGIRRAVEPWIALALASALIPFAVEMTCYYYAFLVLPALLWSERRSAGAILLALSALGAFFSLAPFNGMPVWRDELYTALSLFTVMALGALLALFALPRRAVPAA